MRRTLRHYEKEGRDGWLLDVYIEGGGAVLWVKTEQGVLRLTDEYSPSFYVEPRGEEDFGRLSRVLNDQQEVEAEVEEKKTELGSDEETPLLRVETDVYHFKRLVGKLRDLPEVEELYDTDLLHVQKYVFELGIAPTSRVRVEYNRDGRLFSIQELDDHEELEPPPFTSLLFQVEAESHRMTPDPRRDPVSRIEAWHGAEGETFQGGEEELLQEFADYVRERNPDLLVASNCDESFDYLLKRCKALGLDLQLGRELVQTAKVNRPLPYWVRGRVALDLDRWVYTFDEWGVAGLVERTRFSMLPPGLAWRWTANRVIDSRNCFELQERGYAVKEDASGYQHARKLGEVYDRDVGGIIFPPRLGEVHENVAELDVTSEYPSLIVNECISYETVKPDGVEPREDALLPTITQELLERRFRFKELREGFPEESREWRWCEQRQQSLKLLLVCIYGTSGCCWNRYGNVLAFEEINERSRDALLTAARRAQREGYQVVYGDTDSVFLKKPEASGEEYEELAERLGEEIGLEVEVDRRYRFLLLLPQKADPSSGLDAQKHYLGLLEGGDVHARGVELRRHDVPPFVRSFQRELIRRLLDHDSKEDVESQGYWRALAYVSEAMEKLKKGDVSPLDLVVTERLRKGTEEYESSLPHVSAARQLESRGKRLREGEDVRYVYTDADNPAPLQRVAAYVPGEEVRRYHREKYVDVLLDAAETVLSQLGFDKEEFLERRQGKITGRREATITDYLDQEGDREGDDFQLLLGGEEEFYLHLSGDEGSSWRLPRGPPSEPGVRRVAHRLEEPIEDIIQGGGEEVDSGPYLEKSRSESSLLVQLMGNLLRGEYVFRRSEENRETWLLYSRRVMKI